MNDRSHEEVQEHAGWDLLVEGLMRTDFGRAIDCAHLLARAEDRVRRRDGRLIVATWAAVLLLSLGTALLGAGLGSRTALQSERLTRVSLSHSTPPPESTRSTGDRP